MYEKQIPQTIDIVLYHTHEHNIRKYDADSLTRNFMRGWLGLLCLSVQRHLFIAAANRIMYAFGSCQFGVRFIYVNFSCLDL